MERIKSLFATPKKAMLTCLIIVIAFVVLSVGAVFAAVYYDRNEDQLESKVKNAIAPADTQTVAQQDQSDQKQAEASDQKQAEANDQSEENQQSSSDKQAAAPDAQSNQPSKRISEKKAESIALKDAGFNAGQVSNLFSHLDYDDGYYEYEVQFYKGDMEYDYTLDASSGNIMEKDIESIYD